ncbi:hypothetical protein [Nocardia sp. NPDC050793]|uniref:hypothetical protein n=1 Tax=Nocardia sp. NPDC050793 TaxID=3155159 RepID=UPI0033F60E16
MRNRRAVRLCLVGDANRLPEIIAWQYDLDRRNAAAAVAISATYFRAVATPGPVNRFAGDERTRLA